MSNLILFFAENKDTCT